MFTKPQISLTVLIIIITTIMFWIFYHKTQYGVVLLKYETTDVQKLTSVKVQREAIVAPCLW